MRCAKVIHYKPENYLLVSFFFCYHCSLMLMSNATKFSHERKIVCFKITIIQIQYVSLVFTYRYKRLHKAFTVAKNIGAKDLFMVRCRIMLQCCFYNYYAHPESILDYPLPS